MAKVNAPLFSPEVRGRVGDTVFRRWRSITTASANPGGAGGAPSPGYLWALDAAADWGLLTESQRAGWDKYGYRIDRGIAAIGVRHLPGYCEYVSCYVRAKQCGETPVSDAPATGLPVPVVGFSIAQHSTEDRVVLTWPTVQDGDYVMLEKIENHPPGRKVFMCQLGNWKWAVVASGGDQSGILTVGKKDGYRASLVRVSGQRGPGSYLELIVT